MNNISYSLFIGLLLSTVALSAQNSFITPEQEVLLAKEAVLAPADTVKYYAVGDVIEDFRLLNVDGRYISLSDYPDAKGFIVVFTCNNCPCAADYLKRMIWMSKKYGPMGYPLIAVNANKADRKFGESLEEMAVRADTSGFNFPYLIDETQSVARLYGANKTPEAFVLMRDTTLQWAYRLVYSGAIDDKPADQRKVKRFYVGEAIAMSEQGVPLEFTRVEPMGCTIEGVGLAGKNCPMQALEDRVKAALGD